jgi:hypothetical protein
MLARFGDAFLERAEPIVASREVVYGAGLLASE